ncbi:MAG TPA: PqqD family protein [Chloroflexota bacterium]|nr:PqqD family protein [Chloroflexota bacterium]
MARVPLADLGNHAPIRPQCVSGVETQWLDDELVLFNPQGNRVHLLNASGGAILILCDGTLTEVEIAGELAAFYGLESQHALAEVRVFLADLDTAGVLVQSQGDEDHDSHLQDAARLGRRAFSFPPDSTQGQGHSA